MKKSITNPEVQLVRFEEIDILCASETSIQTTNDDENLDDYTDKAGSRSPWGGSPWD